MKNLSIVVAVATIAGVCTGLQAGTVNDANFFSSISHTMISFEYDGDGNAVIIPEGDIQEMDYDEYQSSYGVWFDYEPYGFPMNVHYVNDEGDDHDEAQTRSGGTLDNSILDVETGTITLVFDVPVRAFGFWVFTNKDLAEPNTPVFTARDSDDNILDTVAFEGSQIHGTVGVINYGFMGLWADEDIASVDIDKPDDHSGLDSLYFSDVPEPATVGLLVLGGLAVLRRRARR